MSARALTIAADEFRRLKGSMTGKALIEAMQASPYREIELEPKYWRSYDVAQEGVMTPKSG